MGIHTRFQTLFDLNVTSIIAAGLILATITIALKLLEDLYVHVMDDSIENRYKPCKERLVSLLIVGVITAAFLIIIYEYWNYHHRIGSL